MNVKQLLGRWRGIGVLAGLTIMVVVLALALGCQEQKTPGSAASPSSSTVSAGASTGTLSGKVTNSLTKGPVAGAKIVTDPVIQGQNVTTDNNGAYTVSLPIGSYKLSITRDGYTAGTDNVILVAGQSMTKDIVLKPTAAVVVSAGTAQTAAPGAKVTLKATANLMDGSKATAFEWKQTAGVPATLANANTDTLTVTLPAAQDYKAALIKGLEILDRVEVKGINPHALLAAETATFTATVTTSTGKYSGKVNVIAELPYEFTTGLANVPQGVPVLLSGKVQDSYNWTITGPSGSKAALDEPAARNPVFTPDVSGKYILAEKVSNATLDVYVGTWSGSITGQDAKGRPLAASCTTCHNGTVAADNFTAWSKSGHAEIFTQNINDPAGHWGINCAECHTVGYAPEVTNGGFDEAVAEEGWKVPPHGDKGLWTEILAKYPKTARLANIQCENCHGPNNGNTLHANGTLDASRISLSSDLCGSCHGEPPRHGRFQQWEESGHGNYELAIDESGRASCARCHTAQGFLTWIKQEDMTKQLQGKDGNATAEEMKAIVTADNAQPVTCVVCHDPHDPGATSGDPNKATVRITGDTKMLPSGFKAENVGKGAICITCHNTRNGLHNDNAPPANFQAPHVAAQADVLMGENAYLVNTGMRSPHSYIENTCVNCHLNETSPPADYSYQLGGTNHAFSADLKICGSCHSATLDGKGLQIGFENKLHELGAQMSKYLLKKLPDTATVKDYTPHTNSGVEYDIKSEPISLAKDNIASVEPTEPHGQQGFLIKLKNPVSVTYKPASGVKGTQHSIDVKELEVQLGDITTDGKTTVFTPTDALVKAGWNYFLMHGDGSEGIHNPDFSMAVLNASIAALK